MSNFLFLKICSILLYLAAVSQRFYVKKSLKTSWRIFIKNHFRSLHTYLRKFFCGYLENQNERLLFQGSAHFDFSSFHT